MSGRKQGLFGIPAGRVLVPTRPVPRSADHTGMWPPQPDGWQAMNRPRIPPKNPWWPVGTPAADSSLPQTCRKEGRPHAALRPTAFQQQLIGDQHGPQHLQRGDSRV